VRAVRSLRSPDALTARALPQALGGIVTLDQATSIAEIAAAVATVVTLAYLAIQIRENTAAQKADARRATQSITSDYSSTIGQDKEVARVFRVGLLDFESLDEDERVQFFFLFAMLVGGADQTFSDYQLEIIDKELFEASVYSVSGMLKTSGGRAFWDSQGKNYTVKFQDYVNSNLFNTG
jgi:hypothetical protein